MTDFRKKCQPKYNKWNQSNFVNFKESIEKWKYYL